MPELPEVEALAGYLRAQLVGKEVARAELAAISALKTFDPTLEEVVGYQVIGAGRRGKFLYLVTRDARGAKLWLVVHLSRSGWVRWRDALPSRRAKPGKGSLALRIGVEGGAGVEFTEASTEKRLSLWIVRDLADVDLVARLGPDALDPSFDAAALSEALDGYGGSIKSALTDQSLIAGIGNAYSDEICHVARFSPFKPAGKLQSQEVVRLHQAIVEVLSEAVARLAGVTPSAIKPEKRSGMKVHGRTGLPCPDCGDTVSEVAFAIRALQYCPTCQTGGRRLADRQLSRLLK